jgi:hypothetical protein
MKKLITFYSESHKDIYDIFYKSYCVYLKNDYILHPLLIEQISPTGEYESKGFDLTMLKKIEWIIKNIDPNDDEPLVFADCDIQFFENINEELGEYDILFQEDIGSYCAGFFICKQNLLVLEFFKYVYETLEINLDGIIHDQTIINHLLFNNIFPNIKVGLLDRNKYWTIANSNGGRVWNGEEINNIPDNIIMHHANFTVGIQNKLQLLNKVKEKNENNQR